MLDAALTSTLDAEVAAVRTRIQRAVDAAVAGAVRGETCDSLLDFLVRATAQAAEGRLHLGQIREALAAS
jgi:hypothetical protein